VVENEMNSATDNPLVYFREDGFQEDTLISAGNFHGEYVAKAADFLATALFTLGKFSEARIERYVNGKVSRLCPFLIKNGGLNSGFMIAQCTSPLPRYHCRPALRKQSPGKAGLRRFHRYLRRPGGPRLDGRVRSP
jgi:histidine ammonia-lyase